MTRRGQKEPIWVLRVVVEAVHYDQILEHGGLPGIRDEAGLDAALARPRNKWAYQSAGMPTLVAAYGFGIARSHPFNDGNKRTAFLTMAIFAERNGYSIDATDPEIVDAIVALAAGLLSEAQFEKWVASKLTRRRRSGSA